MQIIPLTLLFEKFSKAMLKRNKGVPFERPISNVLKTQIVTRYTKLKTQYKQALGRNLSDYGKGIISEDIFLERQKAEIQKAFSNAFSFGKTFGVGSSSPMDDNERLFIVYQTTKELDFMAGFGNAVKTGTGVMPYGKRLSMYSDSLDSMFGFGRLVYMPEDVKIIWRLGITDKHCTDCISFAANSPYTKKTLPGYPKSGASTCLSNCRCSLKYLNNNTTSNSEYDSFITSATPPATRDVPNEQQYVDLMSLREDYFYNRYMFELTKDKKYSELYLSTLQSFNKYKSDNNLYFPVFFNTQQTLIDFKAFMKNQKFDPILSGSQVSTGDFLSLFVSDKQSYVKVQKVFGTQILVKTLEGLEQMVDLNKHFIFKEIP